MDNDYDQENSFWKKGYNLIHFPATFLKYHKDSFHDINRKRILYKKISDDECQHHQFALISEFDDIHGQRIGLFVAGCQLPTGVYRLQ